MEIVTQVAQGDVRQLIVVLVQCLGVTAMLCDRHRRWIQPVLVAAFVAGCAFLALAILMVASGHE